VRILAGIVLLANVALWICLAWDLHRAHRQRGAWVPVDEAVHGDEDVELVSTEVQQ
jgi:hypothetical protein